jgi:hypothetical protein
MCLRPFEHRSNGHLCLTTQLHVAGFMLSVVITFFLFPGVFVILATSRKARRKSLLPVVFEDLLRRNEILKKKAMKEQPSLEAQQVTRRYPLP